MTGLVSLPANVFILDNASTVRTKARFRRCQNAWKGWNLTAPLDTSTESPQLLFKPPVKRTSPTPLRHLALQILTGLVLATEKQSKHSVSQRCPWTKPTGLEQWADSWNCFSQPFWFLTICSVVYLQIEAEVQRRKQLIHQSVERRAIISKCYKPKHPEVYTLQVHRTSGISSCTPKKLPESLFLQFISPSPWDCTVLKLRWTKPHV